MRNNLGPIERAMLKHTKQAEKVKTFTVDRMLAVMAAMGIFLLYWFGFQP